MQLSFTAFIPANFKSDHSHENWCKVVQTESNPCIDLRQEAWRKNWCALLWLALTSDWKWMKMLATKCQLTNFHLHLQSSRSYQGFVNHVLSVGHPCKHQARHPHSTQQGKRIQNWRECLYRRLSTSLYLGVASSHKIKHAEARQVN